MNLATGLSIFIAGFGVGIVTCGAVILIAVAKASGKGGKPPTKDEWRGMD